MKKLCRPILLSTKNAHSQLEIDDLTVGKLSYESKQYHCKNPRQLILISLDPDEEIEVGNQIYYPNIGVVKVVEIEKLIGYSNYKFETADEKCWICDLTNETKNVIATQDQLSPKYIQQFIEEYNKGEVKDVEIESEPIIHKSSDCTNKNCGGGIITFDGQCKICNPDKST